jgi:hypothetical protein
LAGDTQPIRPNPKSSQDAGGSDYTLINADNLAGCITNQQTSA